jgi:hypothetical protein
MVYGVRSIFYGGRDEWEYHGILNGEIELDWFKGNQSIEIMNRTNWHDMIVIGKPIDFVIYWGQIPERSKKQSYYNCDP